MVWDWKQGPQAGKPLLMANKEIREERWGRSKT